MKAIVVFMVCAVPLAGCETAGQSAAGGAALAARCKRPTEGRLGY